MKLIKKILSIIAVIIITTNILSIDASADTVTSQDGIVYTQTGMITAYVGNSSEVIIPSSINGVKINTIGKNVFKNNSNISKVNVSEGITTIDSGAFENCINLYSIVLPSNLTTINNYAFKGCVNLKKITIPKDVQVIGNNVFQECKSLKDINVDKKNTSFSGIDGILFNKNLDTIIKYPNGKKGDKYILPNSVKNINEYSFSGNVYIKELVINEGCLQIKSSAFSSCSSLSTIEISSTVTTIENENFNLCKALTGINVKAENKNYSSESGILFNNDKTNLIKYPEAKVEESYSIPSMVKEISNNSFAFNKALKNISFCEGIEKIGKTAFDSCRLIEKINIPTSVSYVGEGAFVGCTNLKYISIPNKNGLWIGNSIVSSPISKLDIYGLGTIDNAKNLISKFCIDDKTGIGINYNVHLPNSNGIVLDIVSNQVINSLQGTNAIYLKSSTITEDNKEYPKSALANKKVLGVYNVALCKDGVNLDNKSILGKEELIDLAKLSGKAKIYIPCEQNIEQMKEYDVVNVKQDGNIEKIEYTSVTINNKNYYSIELYNSNSNIAIVSKNDITNNVESGDGSNIVIMVGVFLISTLSVIKSKKVS